MNNKFPKARSTKNTPTGKPKIKPKSTGKTVSQPAVIQRSGKKSSLREVFSNLNKNTVFSGQTAPVKAPVNLKYYIIYKPFGTMAQFSRENDKPTLADIKFDFPKDVYPVGRLDADSEGLLLLTNDTSINGKLLNPKNAHNRTYYAQVDGAITEQAIAQLKKGITITVDGKAYKTLPAQVKLLKEEPVLPDRNPPIRVRANIPTSWIEITLTEGKNHQVRKMCAKSGFPVLRLVRVKIGNLALHNLQPGKVKELTEAEIGELVNS